MKLGNHEADVNEDKGAMEEDKRLHDLADFYSHRQRYYAKLMHRIKVFIIGTRKAEKEMRDKIRQSANPPKDPKANQVMMPKQLTEGHPPESPWLELSLEE